RAGRRGRLRGRVHRAHGSAALMGTYLRFELRRWSRRPSVTLFAVGLPAVVYLMNTQAHHGLLSGMSVRTYLLGSMLAWTALIAVVPLVVLGIALGCCVDEVSLRPTMAAITFGLSVIGGLWWPITMFPGAVQAVAKALPTYHLATVERSIASGSVPWIGNLGALAAWGIALTARVLWRFQQDDAGLRPKR